jgi:hypothetical protein
MIRKERTMNPTTETKQHLGEEYARLRCRGRSWTWYTALWAVILTVLWILSFQLPDEREVITGIDPGGSIFSDSERESFGELDDPMLQAAYAQADAQTRRPMQIYTARVDSGAAGLRALCGLACFGLWGIWGGMLFFRARSAYDGIRARLAEFVKTAQRIELPAVAENGSRYLIYGRLVADGQPCVAAIRAGVRQSAVAAAVAAGLQPELCELAADPAPGAPATPRYWSEITDPRTSAAASSVFLSDASNMKSATNADADPVTPATNTL